MQTTTEYLAANMRVSCNCILERKVEYGHAARKNRGRNSGAKIHKLECDYVIGLVDESLETRPGTYGYQWLKQKRAGREAPVLFKCSPACGCTSGQNAGKPIAGLTEESVTCSKCK